jgi:hypothetical protein
MDNRDKNLRLQILRNNLEVFYNLTPQVAKIHTLLDAHGLKGYLFGGAIRDVYVHGPKSARPRDLDIVVTGKVGDYAAFAGSMPRSWERVPVIDDKDDKRSGNENSTNVVRIDGLVADLWHIGTQRGLYQRPESEQTIDKVPGTTFLTIESIVAGIDNCIDLHDDGFIDCMADQLLDCRLEWEGDIVKEKFAVKALALHAKLPGFRMSGNLANFVYRIAKDMTVGDVLTRLANRYGHPVPQLSSLFRVMEDGKNAGESAGFESSGSHHMAS